MEMRYFFYFGGAAVEWIQRRAGAQYFDHASFMVDNNRYTRNTTRFDLFGC